MFYKRSPDISEDYMINRALKIIRLYHGLTQAKLAPQLDMSKSYLCEIETGKKTITYNLLQRYSTFFYIPISSLVLYSEYLNNENDFPNELHSVIANKILTIIDWAARKNETTSL